MRSLTKTGEAGTVDISARRILIIRVLYSKRILRVRVLSQANRRVDDVR